MTARDEQREQRREQILATGLDLFIQKGLASTKVADIADAVGMSVGLLFHYFDSKERLYEELVHIGINKSQNILAANTDEPLAFFEGIIKSVLDRDGLFAAKMFVLMNQAANCDILTEETRHSLRRDNIVRSAEIIKIGQECGAIREGEPLSLSIAFWGAVLGVCQIIVQSPDTPRPQAEWLIDIIRKNEG